MKVTLGTLKDKGEDLATFLEPRVGTKPSLEGGAIEIEDESLREGVKPRHVKTYIKRFLFMNGVRKKYRVFVSGKDLTIQEIVVGEEKKEEEAEKEAEKPAEPEKEAPAGAPEPEEPEAQAKPKPEKPRKAPSKKPRAKKKKTEEPAE